MKARSTMRRTKIILACVLTLGVAVVVGRIFAQTLNQAPMAAKPSATTPALNDGFASPAAAYPQIQSTYSGPSRTPVAESGQANPSYNPLSQPPYYGSLPSAATTNAQFVQPNQPWSARPRTRTVPDPNHPGKSIEVLYYEMVPGRVSSDLDAPADELAQEVAHLLTELRQDPASPPNPEELQKLRKLVAEEFDNRLQSQVSRLEKVQADVQRTYQLLERRNDQRDEIIERRVTQLLGEQDPLQWDYQPTLPVYPSSNQGYGTLPSQSPGGMPLMLPSYSNPQTTYPQVYVAPKSSADPVTTANQYVPGQSRWTSPPNPPNDNVATTSRSPEVDVLGSLVRHIQESRKILEESAGLDNTVAAFSRPNPSKVKEQLAQAEADLKFHTDRLNRAAELKKLDLADAQKQSEAANIEAENAQKLYRLKHISEVEQRLPQIKADVAKNAVKRAEIELSEIEQQLQWLASVNEKSSEQSPLPYAAPDSTDDVETNTDLNSSTPTDGPTPESTDEAVPENTPPLETRM